MSVAKIIEISSASGTSFDDAIQSGIAEAAQSLRGIQGAWIQEQKVVVKNDKIIEYRVNMKVTFLVEGTGTNKERTA